MRYYIADLHFGHENLNTDLDYRGFESAAKMDEYMIKQWNSKVRPNDEVVILGDFCISPKADIVADILCKLNGKKYLVKGNHDNYLDSKSFDKSLFGWIEDYKEMKDEKRKVILSHYPVFCYNGQFYVDSKGDPKTYMLYGHVHNSFDEKLVNSFIKQTRDSLRPIKGAANPINTPCQMINCFCMFSDYIPLTLDEWIEVDKNRRFKLDNTEQSESL